MKSKYDVIIAPVVTEKSNELKSLDNKYVFKVNPKANKFQIKQAVEQLFKVKVESVNTLNTHPKNKKVGRYTGKTTNYKKAIVKLAKESTISFE
ncbi:MAG: 50S ribosomal protein L23 [bacterium]|nr:50S ribosomal protein L23 [bacterium]